MHCHGSRSGPALRAETLDCHDLLLRLQRTKRQRARPDCLAINMDRAGAALGGAAAIFGASESDLFAKHPQQRGVRVRADLKRLAVDSKPGHGISPDLAHLEE